MTKANRLVSRRTVLRGAGVALALPWLESLAPREARGQLAQPPRTYVGMTFPCGTAEYWKPAQTGAGNAWALSAILEPLAPVKSWLNVLANVGNYGPFGGHVEPSNSNLTAALLTCTRAVASDPFNATCGTSVDQIIAQHFSGSTKIDSLQVGLSTLDSYTDGMPAACSRSISWSSPTTPMFKNVDPQSVFDQIVGVAHLVPGAADPFAAARRAKHQSVLDAVLAHAQTVRTKVGQSDGQRLDGFMTSVRALEQRIAAGAIQSCDAVPRPTESFTVGNVPADYDRGVHADLMIDLVVMALECDVTRFVSFMMDDARSDFVYSFLPMRHFTVGSTTSTPAMGTCPGLYGSNAAGALNDGYATIIRFFAEKASRLAQRLAAIPSANGTMLDDATISLVSEMHGPNHDGLDLPLLTIGRGGNRLKTNQSIDFAKTARQTERLSNLYLTFIQKVFDLPVQTFGGDVPMQPPSQFQPAQPANAYGPGTTPIAEILA